MFNTIFNDLIILMIFLVIGFVLRELIKPLQKMFIPAGIIGGIVAIVVGPQVLNWVDIPASWGQMPGTMVGVVLSCTMFGVTFNRSKIKSYLGAINILFSTFFAQLFVGMVVGIFLSGFWDIPDIWGSFAAFAFWGGFGYTTTAAAVYETYGINILNIGIILATLGVILSMLLGMIIVNIGVRRGFGQKSTANIKGDGGTIPLEEQKAIGFANVSSSAISPLALQLALVLGAVFLGQELFAFLSQFSSLFANAPMILCGIVGAAIIWKIMQGLKLQDYVEKKSIHAISGVALEICILSATATIDIKIFADYFAPIIIFTSIIMVLMFLYVFIIIPRWMKTSPFEFALMVFGLGVGSTPSGLALARCVDPDAETSAWDAFGVSSGFTAAVCALLSAFLPVLGAQSKWYLVIIGLIVTAATFILGEALRRKA